MIPLELRELKQWTYSFNKDEPKRPVHIKYVPDGGLTYELARHKANGLFHGLYVTSEDPYILGDIDHVKNVNEPFVELPVPLADLLINNPTYCEVSPSGKGLRFIYRFVGPEEKALLEGSVFLLKVFDKTSREAEIHTGPPWMTITGKETNFSVSKVSRVTLRTLSGIFNTDRDKSIDVIDVPKDELPPQLELFGALNALPLSPTPRMVRAFKAVFGVDYSHYTYWMKVMMGMHHYSTIAEAGVDCFHAFDSWSRRDEEHYQGEDDCYKHWRSLANKTNRVSYKTIFALYYKLNPMWPRPKPQTKSERKSKMSHKPLVVELANFDMVLEKYNMVIHHSYGSTQELYISGDADIMNKYFRGSYSTTCFYGKYWGPYSAKALSQILLRTCQDEGYYGLTLSHLTPLVNAAARESDSTIDIFKYYFERPVEFFKGMVDDNIAAYHRSSFDSLMDCIRFKYLTDDHKKECELYRTYVKVWLMGMFRYSFTIDPHKHTNNCILILGGREQTRKTSFFKQLLPPFLREIYTRIVAHGLSSESDIRDLSKISSTCRIIVFDEIDTILKDSNSEARLKKVIDNTPQTFIDKYEVISSMSRPQAVYGGTTNRRALNFGDEGSRRFFYIPVKWVNVEAMELLCFHKIGTDIVTELRQSIKVGNTPWLLTPAQLQYQSELHKNIRADTNLDLALQEVWDFDTTLDLRHGILPNVSSFQVDKSGRLMTPKYIKLMLLRYDDRLNVSESALKRSLERQCGLFTGTQLDPVVLHKPACEIYKGRAKQSSHIRWVLPPIKKAFKIEFNNVLSLIA